MIVILKVGGAPAVAEYVRAAIAQECLPWKLVQVSTLNQARLALGRERVDLLVLHHQLPDAGLFGADDLNALDDLVAVPRLLSVTPGHEAAAAQALEQGFAGLVLESVQDGLGALLVAQLRGALKHRETARVLHENNEVLTAISRVQSRFWEPGLGDSAFGPTLSDVLHLTHSPVGWLAEVPPSPAEFAWQLQAVQPPKTLGLASRAPEPVAGQWLQPPTGTVLMNAALSGEPLLIQRPYAHVGPLGLPTSWPVPQCMLVLPIGAGPVVAVLALLNRPGGYSERLVNLLKPVTDTLAQLVQARRAERARAQAMSVLQTTLDSIDQGLTMVDAQGRFVLSNRRAMELLDLTEQELAQQPDHHGLLARLRQRGDFGPNGAWVHDEQARAYLLAPEQVPVVPKVYRRTTAQGRVLEVTVNPLPTQEVVRTFTDVTAAVEAQTTLLDTQERLAQRTQALETVLHTVPQGLLVVDASGHVVLHNEQLLQLLELPAELMQGHPPLKQVIRFQQSRGDFGEQSSWVLPHFREAFASQIGQDREAHTRRYVRKTRQGLYLEVKSDPLPTGGFVRTFTDVTTFFDAMQELQERSDEVKRLNETLEQRVAQRTVEVERAMRDVEALSYSIAHDLRGPLRAVNGFASLIAAEEADRLTPDGRELFARITEASKRMGEMITDLLELFKVVRADLNPVQVDLSRLAQEALRSLAAAYPRTQVDVEPMPLALGDAALLKLLMFNLLDNALKYSAKAEHPHISVGCRNGAWFVKDNGVGFDMSRAGKLFGLFQRLHSPTDFEGSGVGLALVARVVQRHGGEIWAESAPGQGATFWFKW